MQQHRHRCVAASNKGNGRDFSARESDLDSRTIAHNETRDRRLIHRTTYLTPSSRPERSRVEGPSLDDQPQFAERRSLRCASLRSASVGTTEGYAPAIRSA